MPASFLENQHAEVAEKGGESARFMQVEIYTEDRR